MPGRAYGSADVHVAHSGWRPDWLTDDTATTGDRAADAGGAGGAHVRLASRASSPRTGCRRLHRQRRARLAADRQALASRVCARRGWRPAITARRFAGVARAPRSAPVHQWQAASRAGERCPPSRCHVGEIARRRRPGQHRPLTAVAMEQGDADPPGTRLAGGRRSCRPAPQLPAGSTSRCSRWLAVSATRSSCALRRLPFIRPAGAGRTISAP